MRTRIICITSEEAEAINLIAKVNFFVTQCVPSCKAGTLGLKLDNWYKMRQSDEYRRYMRHYRLDGLANNSDAFGTLAEAFTAASKANEGVVVAIS